jgi:hypothetical protein
MEFIYHGLREDVPGQKNLVGNVKVEETAEQIDL